METSIVRMQTVCYHLYTYSGVFSGSAPGMNKERFKSMQRSKTAVPTGPGKPVQHLLKRLMDIGIALLTLLLLAPLFLLIALLIKLRMPGPVLFLQERIGRQGRPFRMLKFRTMVVDAEEQRAELEAFNETGGPTFKMTNDPRITPLGRVLRKYSLDEFPQLINVLQGHMSLVGPRPLPIYEVDHLSESHRRRLSVLPGITGLSQVSGRSDLCWEEWLNLDLEYIDTWNIFEDIRILVKTLFVVLRGHGAR